MQNVPTFVDLQGFFVNEKFVAKEIAVLKSGNILTHYVFREALPWNLLTRTEKSRVCWLTANFHGLQWKDGDVSYERVGTFLRRAIRGGSDDNENDDNERYGLPSIIYVKGLEKRNWLKEILGNEMEEVPIETMEIDFEDIHRLINMDKTGTFRCGRHAKNCAMENVFKLRNWWFERRNTLTMMFPNLQIDVPDDDDDDDDEEKKKKENEIEGKKELEKEGKKELEKE